MRFTGCCRLELIQIPFNRPNLQEVGHQPDLWRHDEDHDHEPRGAQSSGPNPSVCPSLRSLASPLIRGIGDCRCCDKLPCTILREIVGLAHPSSHHVLCDLAVRQAKQQGCFGESLAACAPSVPRKQANRLW
jgi:hypothetical protein